MDTELNKFVKDLKKAVDKMYEKYNYDISRVKPKFYLQISDDPATPVVEEIEVIDETKPHPCRFCGKLTYYYDYDKMMFLCADCYVKVKEAKE